MNKDTLAATKILRLPDVLVIALKRFSQDQNGRFVKTFDPICIQRLIIYLEK